MAHFRKNIPLLDADYDAGDKYLSELNVRAMIGSTYATRHHAVSTWLNS